MATSKFTPELRLKLLDRIESGASIPDAATAEGLHESTLKGWLARGREDGSGDFHDFAIDVQEARSRCREQVERPMDRDELEREVWRSVRAGSVAAMKLAWQIMQAKKAEGDESATSDPFGPLDGYDSTRSLVVELDNQRRKRQREKRRGGSTV